MTSILIRVPSPGFSCKGIHNKSTKQLIPRVVHPKFIPVLMDIPWESTIHGEFPRWDCTSSASPIPKRKSEEIKIVIRRGLISQRCLARHGVIGMERCGRNHSVSFLENSDDIRRGYLICLGSRTVIAARIALATCSRVLARP